MNRNNYAGFVNLIIPLALAALLIKSLGSKISNRQTQRSISVFVKNILINLESSLQRYILLSTSIILMAAGLIYSTSRGGLISLICSTFIFFIMLRLGKANVSKGRLTQIFVATTLVIICITILWSNVNPLKQRLNKLANLDYNLNHSRAEAIKSSFRIAQDFPIFGIGLGAFPNLYYRYRSPQISNAAYTASHCDYIQLVSETGIIGFGFFIISISGYIIFVVRRHMRESNAKICTMTAGVLAAISSLLIHSFVDFNAQIPANALIASILFGTVSVIQNRS